MIKEPKQDGSGMPQGVSLNRAKYNNPRRGDGTEPFEPEDYRLGGDLEFAGRAFFVVDCDPYTRRCVFRVVAMNLPCTVYGVLVQPVRH